MSALFNGVALQVELDLLERRAASIETTYRALAGNRVTRRAPGGAQREAQAEAWRMAAKQQLADQFRSIRERLTDVAAAARSELAAAELVPAQGGFSAGEVHDVGGGQ